MIENIFEEFSYFSEMETFLVSYALNLGGKIISAIILIVIFGIVRGIGQKFIRKVFGVKLEKLQQVTGATDRRKITMERLILNIWRYAINITCFLSVIGIFINTTSLLASAGFITVLITFASQSMLDDVVKGFFIVFEDMFSVGDSIETNGYSGTVLEIGLRSTKLQLSTGEVVIIPNSSIKDVINYSVSNSKAVLDVRVAYEADLEKALATLEKVADRAMEEYSEIISRPSVLGIQSLENSEIVIRMLAEVETLQKGYIERELRKKIKLTFDKEGIEMPFPRMVVYKRDGKEMPVNE